MKYFTLIAFSIVFAVLAFTAEANAQCAAKRVAFPTDSNTITLTGKTGGCNKYKFMVDVGQRVIVKITSTDNRARFSMQWDASEDETGTELFENQTSFDRSLEYPEWLIWATGTAGTAFTLKITAVDE